MGKTSLSLLEESCDEDTIDEDILSFIKAAAALMLDTRDPTGYFETASFKALLATDFGFIKSCKVRGIKFEVIIEVKGGTMVAIDAIIPSEEDLYDARGAAVSQVQ